MAVLRTEVEHCPHCGFHMSAPGAHARQAVTEARNVTTRELEVLRLIREGRSNQQISSSLGITTRTVKAHLTSLFGKFEVTSRTELAVHPQVFYITAMTDG